MECLDKNQTWTLIGLPKDSKTVAWRRVFRKKDNEQYKIWLVIKGYAKKDGIDYNEILFLHGELEEKICMK